MKPLQSLLDEVANHSTFHNWAHLLNCYRQQEITTEEFQRLSDLAYKLYYEQGKGPSLEKVEELMNYIEGQLDFWDEELQDPIENIKSKLQSLLSSPQQEKEEVFSLPLEIDNPWPTKDVLGKLIWASEYLLNEKSYDGHNHEEIRICIERGKDILKNIQPPKQVGEGEITEKDFEKLSIGDGSRAFELAQRMVSQALASHRTPSLKTAQEILATKPAITSGDIDKGLVRHYEWNDVIKAMEEYKYSTPSISIEEAKDRAAKEMFMVGYKFNTWKEFEAACMIHRTAALLIQGFDKAMLLYAQHSTPVTKEGETPGLTSKHKDLIRLLLEEAREVLEPYYRSARKRSKNKKQYDYWCMRRHCLENILDGRNPIPSEELPSTPAAGQEEKK